MSWRCDDLRAAAPDLALDELTGADRAEALAHLADCAPCRALVSELAAAADSLLLLAPESEPPAGFESRVLAQVAPVAGALPSARWSPRWRRPLLGAAAALLVTAGIGIGSVVPRGDAGARLPAAAVLVSTDGNTSGSVVLADDPDRMTCVFESERFGGAYRVEVVLDDGTVADVGRFEAGGAPWSWTVPLPVDAADVREVVVRSDDGVIRIRGSIDA